MASTPARLVPRQRSFAGPVVLITLGIIFLIGNLGFVTWNSLGRGFARYWPLLLILWGAIKVLEYYRARNAGEVASGIGVGGGFLIVLIVLLGLTANGISGANLGGLRAQIDMDDAFPLFGNKYEFNQDMVQDLPAHGAVKLVVGRGSIRVSPSPDNKVHISIHKTIVADSREESEKINRESEPRITAPPAPPSPRAPRAPVRSGSRRLPAEAQAELARAHDEVKQAVAEAADAQRDALNAAREALTVEAGRQRGGFVVEDMVVQAPRKAALELLTSHGSLEVNGGREGDITATNTHGDVTLKEIAGNVTVHLQHGDFLASDIRGDLSLEGRIGDSKISNVTGAVSLSGDFFGDIDLSNISQGLRFRSSRTDLELAKLQGELKMVSGDLRANSIVGPLQIHTRSKDIHLEDVNGDVTVENSNAQVELHAGQSTTGAISISNRRGGIELYLPSKTSFQLNARSRGGEISSDFDEVKIDDHGGESQATGTMGSGGRQVQLSNEHGDISILKSG